MISFNHRHKVTEEIGLWGFIYESKSLLGIEGLVGRKPNVRFSYSFKHSTTHNEDVSVDPTLDFLVSSGG